LPEDTGNLLRCKKRQINQLSIMSRGRLLFYNDTRQVQHRKAEKRLPYEERNGGENN